MNGHSGTHFLDSPIEYLKGVGPAKGELLRKELDIHTFRDLLFDFPFRYIDKTQFHKIRDLQSDGQTVQLLGQFSSLRVSGAGRGRKRLTGIFKDDTGSVEIIWFQGVKWISESLKRNVTYRLFGKTTRYKGRVNIAHPEIEIFEQKSVQQAKQLAPVYHSTEKLTARGLDARGRRKLIEHLVPKLRAAHLPENLPDYLIEKLKFSGRLETIRAVHLPKDDAQKDLAVRRMKFEELFFRQLEMLAGKIKRQELAKGHIFSKVGNNVNKYFNEILPFELTDAQKLVIKEIRHDLGSGVQMNRLLQGDVGSGKTVVALMAMLIAIDNGFQCCLLAPTEILAQQHYKSISSELSTTTLRVAFLSGSVKGNTRKQLLAGLRRDTIDILVGTHAVLEDPVVFKNLGLAITDEQHRFGVAQRAKLWKKGRDLPPHILVMTATPIPRTLAMTVYGDLDVSIIDKLPPGRKPVQTMQRSEAGRQQVIRFMQLEIEKGRQIYVIFPLIEESEKLDLENLQEGYEHLLQWFPKPKYQISVVHGRMKSEDKEMEMQRFVRKKTQIMVATTVIEVGVNVPNASVMVIENAERFGLSQLHQLRGRVGRGADQSYCILMTGYKRSKEARERIETMCRTNNGFEIAEADLKLRGPGELAGTRQSGALNFKLVNLAQDAPILTTARHLAQLILTKDPKLEKAQNERLVEYISRSRAFQKEWFRIS